MIKYRKSNGYDRLYYLIQLVNNVSRSNATSNSNHHYRYPSIQNVEKELTANDSISLSFYGTSGYHFSAELIHVYHAKISSATTFKDSLSVCQRALLASKYYMNDIANTNANLKNSTPRMLSLLLQQKIYIIHMIAIWEMKTAHESCIALRIQQNDMIPILSSTYVASYLLLAKSNKNMNGKKTNSTDMI